MIEISIEAIERVAVYRLYDATGRLLYVGIAANPEVRWYSHSRLERWWRDVRRRDVQWHPNRAEAAAEEERAIATEGPLHNISRGHTSREADIPPTARESITRILEAREMLDCALAAVAEAKKALAGTVRAAYAQGVKTGPVSRAAGWSTSHAVAVREAKALT